MRYLKTYEQVTRRYSVFDTDGWEALLPKSLTIVTESGEWTLEKPSGENGMSHATNVSNIMNCVQINYYHNTVEENGGDVTTDGEPDQLEIDITILKENGGSDFNPDSLKLDVEITYGDSMKSEFSISMPGVVEIVNYNGIGSMHDNQTHFGFKEDSLLNLISFFESWGFSLKRESFNFIDERLDSYYPND